LHPVLVSMAIIISFLLITDTLYETYFEVAQLIHC
jgi:putative effector of murein hydrolase